MNRALAATAITFALLGIATTVAAQDDPEPTEPVATDDGSIRIELVDQSFDLTPGGSIDLTYRLLGDLEAVVDVLLLVPHVARHAKHVGLTESVNRFGVDLAAR